MDILSGCAENNVLELKRRFERDMTFILRTAVNRHDKKAVFHLAYCGGMIDNAVVNEYIIGPLINSEAIDHTRPAAVVEEALLGHFPQMTSSFTEIEESIAAGDTVVLLPGGFDAVILSTQGFSARGIAEPTGERVLSGPREGFSEALLGNLSMLHRRFRNGGLKIETRSIGRRTRTRVAVCYLDGVVKPELLKELQKRLDNIDIDGVLDTQSLHELITDQRRSPFRSAGVTERPDIVAGKLLEGRIALIADGSPAVLTLPYLFVENFQSNEDYYVSFIHASFARLLRIAAFFLTTVTPALYICFVSSHYEILPGSMLLNMASEFHNTPFPAAFEAFFMLMVFDILRETGMRMTAGGGQALSIVGALIIGQAAVEAQIVSPQMIIVAALTGITGILLPKLDEACLTLRYILLACASLLGLFGLSAGVVLTVVHLQRLSSLGVDQFGGTRADQKDGLIRAPLWMMNTRPERLSGNRRRLRLWRGKDA
ncbi:MAG: spore germination protein [Oscillospiraceae bacterium]|jgi:spore germination protein KA|nr:spore germination protein [Oscillospiraceae bacterium]